LQALCGSSAAERRRLRPIGGCVFAMSQGRVGDAWTAPMLATDDTADTQVCTCGRSYHPEMIAQLLAAGVSSNDVAVWEQQTTGDSPPDIASTDLTSSVMDGEVLAGVDVVNIDAASTSRGTDL